jgi:hypothetical protein
MKTLGDKLIEFYNGYLAPTKKQLEVGKKELKVTSPNEYALGRKKDDWLSKELSPSQLRKTAQQCPLLMKGIRKKCLDGTRAWLNLEILPNRGDAIKADLDYIYEFEKRNNFRAKWSQTKINSYIYGDGFLLITFLNDDKTQLWQKPSPKAIPWRVDLLDSEHINEFDYYPPKKAYYKGRHTMHFHYLDDTQEKDFWIHPDRVIHLARDPLPCKIFGNSVVNLLRNIIKSKVNIDVAVGEILSWFSHGVFDITVPGIEEEEKEYWQKIVDSHPGSYIHGEDVTITSVKPEAIDPQAFYEYVIMNIAAAIIMPTHLLTGIQVGKVTGAEIGFADYYRDVKDNQELDESPLIEKLYETILKSRGRVWKYSIKWNQIYVDELAEAEIMLKRTQAADLALNGTKGVGGFADEEEVRTMYNKGQIELDTKKKIKHKAPPLPAPKPPAKPVKNEYDYQLSISERAMIEKRRENAKREKALGEQILKEQNV